MHQSLPVVSCGGEPPRQLEKRSLITLGLPPLARQETSAQGWYQKPLFYRPLEQGNAWYGVILWGGDPEQGAKNDAPQ